MPAFTFDYCGRKCKRCFFSSLYTLLFTISSIVTPVCKCLCVYVLVNVCAECTPESLRARYDHELNPGRVLKADDAVLYDISIALGFDMPGLKRFAAHLLEDSGCKLTGDVFFASLDVHEYTTVPSKATALLQYWWVFCFLNIQGLKCDSWRCSGFETLSQSIVLEK